MMHQLRLAVLSASIATVSIVARGQDSQAPVVTLQGNSVKIDGQFAHVQGPMPSRGPSWFYRVERKKANLFVYSFWAINEFRDRKEKNFGFYRAQAWTVEILDSKDHPEKEVVFDRLNDFFFWGNLVRGIDQAQLSIASIEGLSESPYGPVVLKILK
jgi:hypothetical protein